MELPTATFVFIRNATDIEIEESLSYQLQNNTELITESQRNLGLIEIIETQTKILLKQLLRNAKSHQFSATLCLSGVFNVKVVATIRDKSFCDEN
jgi:hypothetical protein